MSRTMCSSANTAPERYAVWFFTALGMAEAFRTAALRIPPAE